MIINKKFILILLMVFLELNLKFIHGSKRKSKKNIKKSIVLRAKKNKSIFQQFNTVSSSVLVKEKINEKKDNLFSGEQLKDSAIVDFDLFKIDENIISQGSEIAFSLNEKDFLGDFNNNESKIYIGDIALNCDIGSEDLQNNINHFALQYFLDEHLSDLLILFMVNCFLIKDNIDIVLKDNIKLTNAEIKFRRKYYLGVGYNIIKFLENNIDLYKKILLIAIMNILDDKKKTDNYYVNILYQKIFNYNKFYNNDLLKSEFLSKLSKINSLNKQFNSKEYESILYMLIVYITKQSDEFFKFMLNKDFFKFILFNTNLNEFDKNNILNKELINKDIVVDKVDKKEADKKNNEILKIYAYSSIMKHCFKILENMFED